MLNGQKVTIKTGKSFAPLPVDKYTVQIDDVNLVRQFDSFKNEEKDVLNYQFGVLDDKEMPTQQGVDQDGSESTRGRFLWKRCSLSMNEKSWLFKLVTATLGKRLTDEEVAQFSPESLIGLQVDVMVEQVTAKDGSGKIFNSILSFSKTTKKLAGYAIERKLDTQKVAEEVFLVTSTLAAKAKTKTKVSEDTFGDGTTVLGSTESDGIPF